MAWTTPKTDWTTGELVTAEDMNAVGENLATIHNVSKNVAAFTTTENITLPGGAAFVDIDSDNLNLTIATSGGDVMVHCPVARFVILMLKLTETGMAMTAAESCMCMAGVIHGQS